MGLNFDPQQIQILKALGEAGADSDTLQQMVMGLISEQLTRPQQQQEQEGKLRELIATRMLDEEQPDYAKVRQVLNSDEDLGSLFAQVDQQAQGADDAMNQKNQERQLLAIDKATKEGDTDYASKLSKLSPTQYSKLSQREKEFSFGSGEKTGLFGSDISRVPFLSSIPGAKQALNTSQSATRVLNPFVNLAPGSGKLTDSGKQKREDIIRQLMSQ